MCKALNHFKDFLIFISAVSGCVSISVIASLVGIPIGITSYAGELKICVVTAGV